MCDSTVEDDEKTWRRNVLMLYSHIGIRLSTQATVTLLSKEPLYIVYYTPKKPYSSDLLWKAPIREESCLRSNLRAVTGWGQVRRWGSGLGA